MVTAVYAQPTIRLCILLDYSFRMPVLPVHGDFRFPGQHGGSIDRRFRARFGLSGGHDDPYPKPHRSVRVGAGFLRAGRGQDSPSLGDLARQAQKDKANKPPAKVITNDDVASGSGDISSSLGSSTGSAQTAQPGVPGKTGDPGSPAVGFEKLQTLLDQLDSLDAATLASNVLQGNETNFSGRSRWEAKLYAAKQTFVAESRSVLERRDNFRQPPKA